MQSFVYFFIIHWVLGTPHVTTVHSIKSLMASNANKSTTVWSRGVEVEQCTLTRALY